MKKLFRMTAIAVLLSFQLKADACTGITLRTTNGSPVTARTIEWAGNDLGSCYTIVPRGYSQRSYTSSGSKDGMMFTARYGYVGLAVEKEEFVVEGINESGLPAGLFYFPFNPKTTILAIIISPPKMVAAEGTSPNMANPIAVDKRGVRN